MARIHDVLYRELGFRGPTAAEYGDPSNSHLDEVIATTVGLPISLAIVELEVAARLGLTLAGIGLPGHFIVGGPDGLLIDPADGGRSLTRDDCQALIRRAIGDGVLFHASMLRPSGRREILARVLRNLRAARLARRDWPAAVDAVDLLLVLEPTDPEHGRDRGLLLGRMGRFGEAVAALRLYPTSDPTPTTYRMSGRCWESSPPAQLTPDERRCLRPGRSPRRRRDRDPGSTGSRLRGGDLSAGAGQAAADEPTPSRPPRTRPPSNRPPSIRKPISGEAKR